MENEYVHGRLEGDLPVSLPCSVRRMRLHTGHKSCKKCHRFLCLGVVFERPESGVGEAMSMP